MKVRTFGLVLVALAVALFVNGSVQAEKEKADKKGDSHEGTVVSASGHKLVMKDKDGKNEHTHEIAKDTRVTCDGKECKLEDLKEGMKVRVTMKEEKKAVAKVEALDKNKEFPKDDK